mmetsp:Transcript_5962/g.23135  ORF Transcript_5962/g.23135 Transcript_5962/m.23135 type:complete len:333 (+) Transcript_5962:1353-2351(+)
MRRSWRPWCPWRPWRSWRPRARHAFRGSLLGPVARRPVLLLFWAPSILPLGAHVATVSGFAADAILRVRFRVWFWLCRGQERAEGPHHSIGHGEGGLLGGAQLGQLPAPSARSTLLRERSSPPGLRWRLPIACKDQIWVGKRIRVQTGERPGPCRLEQAQHFLSKLLHVFGALQQAPFCMQCLLALPGKGPELRQEQCALFRTASHEALPHEAQRADVREAEHPLVRAATLALTHVVPVGSPAFPADEGQKEACCLYPAAPEAAVQHHEGTLVGAIRKGKQARQGRRLQLPRRVHHHFGESPRKPPQQQDDLDQEKLVEGPFSARGVHHSTF